MTDEATGRLLGRFISALQRVLPLVSVWAHGSLAGGDYQPGRSDLDLIAILGRPCTAAEEQQLGEVHESLGSAIALASGLHCSYCAAGELDDPARLHLTWAHEEFIDRKSTRLYSSHLVSSYAVFCLKKKKCRVSSALRCDTGRVSGPEMPRIACRLTAPKDSIWFFFF